jgi:hypothetical protein
MGYLLATRAKTRRPHPAGIGSSASFATRVLSLLCLLLVALASTAQAVHAHGVGLPDRTAHVGQLHGSSVTPDDSVCPLCVAMHSAMPAAATHPALRLCLQAADVDPSTLASAAEPEHFAGFSRPPPAPAALLG